MDMGWRKRIRSSRRIIVGGREEREEGGKK
jgi:hypothetical protein